MEKVSIPTSDQGDLWLHQFCIVVVQAVIDHIECLGFEINPYEIFVANKIFEVTQCTID